MEKYVLYTTHCPKCEILEKKLNAKKIEHEICEDIDRMKELGIVTVPVLEIPDGSRLDYFAAVKYVNGL